MTKPCVLTRNQGLANDSTNYEMFGYGQILGMECFVEARGQVRETLVFQGNKVLELIDMKWGAFNLLLIQKL